MARLPRLMGRGRALEVLLGADDIPGDLAERYGYVNRSFPDSELDAFVESLATRIAAFDNESNIDQVVRASLGDLERGVVVSVPGAQYKTIVAAAKMVPARVTRFLASRVASALPMLAASSGDTRSSASMQRTQSFFA